MGIPDFHKLDKWEDTNVLFDHEWLTEVLKQHSINNNFIYVGSVYCFIFEIL